MTTDTNFIRNSTTMVVAVGGFLFVRSFWLGSGNYFCCMIHTIDVEQASDRSVLNVAKESSHYASVLAADTVLER